MSEDVIDLGAERNRRAQPDEQFVKHDDYGRPIYLFLLEYQMDDKSWQAEVWAYDFEDAEKRVEAMRTSLTLLGQSYEQVPA